MQRCRPQLLHGVMQLAMNLHVYVHRPESRQQSIAIAITYVQNLESDRQLNCPKNVVFYVVNRSNRLDIPCDIHVPCVASPADDATSKAYRAQRTSP